MDNFPFLPSAVWKVTDLNAFIRILLEEEQTLKDLWVQGEISNFSRPVSGHIYFTLKDEKASIRCVIWRNSARNLNISPQNGDAVEVHGSVGVYEQGGQYQLYVDIVRPLGEGRLYQEFIRLKTSLEAEGLFDPSRKRELPDRPQSIGIITSVTGAAIRDILHTIRRRYPLAKVTIMPSSVQGESAPSEIVKGLTVLNTYIKPNVIIIARGGGSIEDLWAFNDERVARAIFDSEIPVVTGIGHETDFTIADFVSDLRAPTPTAAAELVTPNRYDLKQELFGFIEYLNTTIHNKIDSERFASDSLVNRLNLFSPLNKICSDRQFVDEMSRFLSIKMMHRLELQRAYVNSLARRLQGLNPLEILARGYAIVTQASGTIVRMPNQVAFGEELDVRLQGGSIKVNVKGE